MALSVTASRSTWIDLAVSFPSAKTRPILDARDHMPQSVVNAPHAVAITWDVRPRRVAEGIGSEHGRPMCMAPANVLLPWVTDSTRWGELSDARPCGASRSRRTPAFHSGTGAEHVAHGGRLPASGRIKSMPASCWPSECICSWDVVPQVQCTAGSWTLGDRLRWTDDVCADTGPDTAYKV